MLLIQKRLKLFKVGDKVIVVKTSHYWFRLELEVAVVYKKYIKCTNTEKGPLYFNSEELVLATNINRLLYV